MTVATCSRCHGEILWGSLATEHDIAAGVCPVPCETRPVPTPHVPQMPDAADVLDAVANIAIADSWHEPDKGALFVVATNEADAAAIARAAKRLGYAALRTMTSVRVTVPSP